MSSSKTHHGPVLPSQTPLPNSSFSVNTWWINITMRLCLHDPVCSQWLDLPANHRAYDTWVFRGQLVSKWYHPAVTYLDVGFLAFRPEKKPKQTNSNCLKLPIVQSATESKNIFHVQGLSRLHYAHVQHHSSGLTGRKATWGRVCCLSEHWPSGPMTGGIQNSLH